MAHTVVERLTKLEGEMAEVLKMKPAMESVIVYVQNQATKDAWRAKVHFALLGGLISLIVGTVMTLLSGHHITIN